MNVTQDYIDWLAEEEAFSSKAYKDGSVNGVQMYSIGYGHQIQPNEQYLRTATIDKAKGKQLLNTDVKDRVNFVNSKLKKAITQNQFHACVDCCYNAGVGAWQNEILPLINGGSSAATIAAKIKGWRTTKTENGIRITVPALIKRRSEVASWYTGSPIVTILSAIKKVAIMLAVIVAGTYLVYLYNGEKFPIHI
ncbi:hypothetical protein CKK33_11475 [Mucilaginibacter sp. MD40]|uniref:lysozyme n=1 Tax=Mucilaginibacter sp. MD40 TaxID=2029590 RepID=UPI000BAC5FC0|nr:lysozyme [Mucilaginibacter sp. MD40]PAW94081.1 hypothetical protein CKK33_11475 [Mucilaginibacter sp. MD40]